MTEYLELSAPTVADELNRRREKNRRRHINPAIIGKNRKKKTNAAATGSVRAQNLRPSWAKLDVACAHEEKRQLRNSRTQAAEKSVASHGARQRIACRKKRGSLRFLSSLMCRNWAPPTPFLAHVPRLRLRVRRNGTHASDEPLAWSWDFPSTELLKTSSGIRGTQDSLSQRDRLRI